MKQSIYCSAIGSGVAKGGFVGIKVGEMLNQIQPIGQPAQIDSDLRQKLGLGKGCRTVFT
uniref:Uncharacterized protein n=1 Tax=mine drainage metagenome TaxID=410659 RepID=E6QCA2_9ZZZZ